MTFEKLEKIIRNNDIPKNVILESDSGWECNATVMNGVYYNEKENTIVFTQNINELDWYYHSEEWQILEEE